MSAHDWPSFDEHLGLAKIVQAARNGDPEKVVALTEAQYNYAKVRIDACAGIEDAALNHAIDAGGWKDISAQWIQNLANANDCITRQRKELDNYIETTGSAFNRLEQQRDALQQRCEELEMQLLNAFQLVKNGKRLGTLKFNQFKKAMLVPHNSFGEAIAKQVQPCNPPPTGAGEL